MPSLCGNKRASLNNLEALNICPFLVLLEHKFYQQSKDNTNIIGVRAIGGQLRFFGQQEKFRQNICKLLFVIDIFYFYYLKSVL